ncbi:MAG: hypothetical protein M1828_003250 [Chrysothrix sp. TS-e1954]|nr:MAG: hypothetical protein M1828_003250 [Chrysothrix sp. TS-e1954]
MATSENLIDFDVIENQKENIQSLPSGRSAKSLATVFSPVAQKSPSQTQNANDPARVEFEKELATIDDSDDPLDVYDRYVKWTLSTYPSAQATPDSGLLPLLERATKAFLASAHYKNDVRYLRLWLHYIRFFSDAPREIFAYLARHGVGESLALYYEEFAAWLEGAGRWSQAEEVYKMGIEREARPVERLVRKFGEFERRLQNRPQDIQGPSSPALPTVRPALAAKLDPFAATSATPDTHDPQAAARQAGAAAASRPRKQKLEIFSDESNSDPRSAPGSESSGGWQSIGTVAERKKENSISAKPWAGETLKTSAPRSGAPKMAIFKDQLSSKAIQYHLPPSAPSSISPGHPSSDQRMLNSRTGRLECVAVNLFAVYPDPTDPSTEFCFEELRAAKRGWLQRDWAAERKGTSKQDRHVGVDPLSHALSQGSGTLTPEQQLIDLDIDAMPRAFETKLRLNDELDENDENQPPHIGDKQDKAQQQKDEVARKLARREERANRTRKIKVREVKGETQTIQTNLSSPRGPKIKRKKSAEQTMTVHTRAATDEVYELFNQPLQSDQIGEESDTESSSDDVDADDYTSTGESTGTGPLSGTTSELGEDTQGDFTTTQQHVDGEADETETTAHLEGEADQTETTENVENTGWTDFDTKKDVPRFGEQDAEETADKQDDTQASQAEQDDEPYTDQDLITPTSPTPVVTNENRQTRYVPLPPEDFEAPTRPYRDPAVVANNRLPFMTPIVEKTESSFGTAATSRQDTDYITVKTPCPKAESKASIISELEADDEHSNTPRSSPFGDDVSDTLTKHQAIAPPKLAPEVEPTAVATSSTLVSRTKSSLTKQPPKEPAHLREPVVHETQCNPMDEHIRATILKEMYPPVSSLEGYYEHKDDFHGRKPEIKKFCKNMANAKSGSRGAEKIANATVQLPPVLNFEDSTGKFEIKRQLGEGAFAPVYLIEHASVDREEDQDDAPARMGQGAYSSTFRRPLEAMKMEDPPTAWEFYIIRTAKRRLGVSRAADSIIDAYEMHLFKDECYLVEEYRNQGTLLDLVNLCGREPNLSGGSTGGGMDESLAMFFVVELLRTVEALHGKGIIHGDLKADNVLLRFDFASNGASGFSDSTNDDLSPRYSRSGTNSWSTKGITLIDFGRGIDTRAFPQHCQFIADWPTGPTDCAEMRDLRPWTYQADYHGLAAIAHTLLFGKYIDTIAEKGAGLGPGAGAKTYKIKESLKRYWQTELWGDMFGLLLNSGRRVDSEDGARLPALRGLKSIRERMETHLEEQGEKGLGLRGMIRRAESLPVTPTLPDYQTSLNLALEITPKLHPMAPDPPPPQAPQIPNLLSKLRSRPASSSRNARAPHTTSNDDAIQQTDDDASGSRLSAVAVGYLDDPFAEAFSSNPGAVRRQPIINRGTYVRTTSIDSYVRRFLAAHPDEEVQILSIGAGTDTRPFRLLREDPSLARRLHYHEVDFPVTTAKKIQCIEKSSLVQDLLPVEANHRSFSVSADKTSLVSSCYSVHGLDLRRIALGSPKGDVHMEKSPGSEPPQASQPKPPATAPELLPGISRTKPTLLLSECLLSYLDPELSSSLLIHLCNTLFLPSTPLEILLYEPLHPETPFGRTMQQNLASRSISLPGLEAYSTLESHFTRLKDLGFEHREGTDIGRWWKERVSEEEKARLRSLEGLDEEEEWEIMGRQWGIVWGGNSGRGADDGDKTPVA